MAVIQIVAIIVIIILFNILIQWKLNQST